MLNIICITNNCQQVRSIATFISVGHYIMTIPQTPQNKLAKFKLHITLIVRLCAFTSKSEIHLRPFLIETPKRLIIINKPKQRIWRYCKLTSKLN